MPDARFDLAGVPALAQPIGAAEDGLPASLQIIGPALGEPLVLAAGTALEDALASAGEVSRRAPLLPGRHGMSAAG